MAAPSYFGIAVNPADNGSQLDDATLAVTPPASMNAGDLVIFIGQVQLVNPSSPIAISEAGGQSWSSAVLIDPNTNDCSGALFWCQFNGTWTANPSIIFAAESGNQPCSVQMHVARQGTVTGNWAVDTTIVVTNEGTETPTVIAGITPNNDNNFTLAGWLIQGARTYGNVSGTGWADAGGTQYRNTGGTDFTQSYAYQVQETKAATNDASKTPDTISGTNSFIMCWYVAGAATPLTQEVSDNANNLAEDKNLVLGHNLNLIGNG